MPTRPGRSNSRTSTVTRPDPAPVAQRSELSAARASVAPAPNRSGWLAGLAIYRQPRLIAILLMGFSSGLPLALTFATLSFRLAEAGVSRTEIGLFALVGVSYSLKFLWSPLIDRMPLPALTRRLGRRRGWALAIQPALAAAIVALGLCDPKSEPAATAIAAVVVAFLSASQDIVIDAYRIELLRPEEQGAGAAATQWGYRFGMLASSAGALYAASLGGWRFAYALMAALIGIGMAAVWFTPEPEVAGALDGPPQGSLFGRLAAWFGQSVLAPFADILGRRGAIAILAFVVFYKFGDALAATMSNPLYVFLHFTKVEVANIGKLYGFAAALAGLALGGVIVLRLGVFRALFLCGALQMASNLMYIVQLRAGHDLRILALTIGTENLTGGMASAAFVAYLSDLCNLAFTATQYALLSSLAAVGRTTLSASGGALADHFGWTPFFLLSTAACLPGLALLAWIMRSSAPAEPAGVPRVMRQ